MPSSEEEDDEEKALEDEIRECQRHKKEIVENVRPFSEELAKIAQREDECRDRLRRLRAEKRGREKQQQADESLSVVEVDASALQTRSEILDSSNATDSELSHVKCEVVELKQSLEQAAKQSKTQLEKIAELECSVTATQLELRETRQRLSDVQERLTVAEQVTAATQQRALQESDNSEQLQLELTPQHQPTRRTGLRVSFTPV